VFLLLAAVRGHGDIDWSNPLAPVLVAGVATMMLLDVVALARAYYLPATASSASSSAAPRGTTTTGTGE
jgi:hypothetical protein